MGSANHATFLNFSHPMFKDWNSYSKQWELKKNIALLYEVYSDSKLEI
jgi:hypothetical protein